MATAILDDLRRIVQILRESSRRAESEIGVTAAQLFVLRSLDGDKPLSVNDLGARTRTHQSTVSVVVKRLIERDLVRSSVSESDARRVDLALTRKGRALLRKAPLAAQDRLIDGLETLSARQSATLAKALHQWVEAMHLEAVTPQMFFEDGKAKKRSRRAAS